MLCRYAYSADQLEYHYTKNKDVLRRAVAALQERQQLQPQHVDGGSNVTALQR